MLDNYIVVKINRFSGLPFDTVNNAWNLAIEHAEAQGHDKLLLDLGKNDGESLFAGYTLTTCMFPDARYGMIVQTSNFVSTDVIRVTNGLLLAFLEESDGVSGKKATLRGSWMDSTTKSTLVLTGSIKRLKSC